MNDQFKEGMVAGSKPFEEKFTKQADAIEKLGESVVETVKNHVNDNLRETNEAVDFIIDKLSIQERKQIYSMNTIVDIAELDKTEQEYLCGIAYSLVKSLDAITDGQKEYLRGLKAYLMIPDVLTDVDINSIENIDNITTQKAILQVIMELLYIGYGNHNYLNDYEELFECFSVNKKGIAEIQNKIDAMCEAVGLEGIVQHYASQQKISSVSIEDSDDDVQMIKKAEDAYLRYDMSNAFLSFNCLAEKGNARACYFLGEFYAHGYAGVVKKDGEKAKKWRQLGAERGDVLSRLNCAYSSDDEAEKKAIFSEMFDDVLTLARQGDVFAMDELSSLFQYGLGVAADKEKARFWLKEATNLGFWYSITKLAKEIGKEDPVEEVRLLQKAVELGYERALYLLAVCFDKGKGVEENKQVALNYFMQAAERGNITAQIIVGHTYFVEFNIWGRSDMNYSEAEKWYKRAAENGSGEACFWIACVLYHRNMSLDGKTKEEKKNDITEWYYKGMKLGDDDCAIHYAERVCRGEGIADKKEGLKGDAKAILIDYAKAGYKTAQYFLGILYTNSEWLGKDKEIARMWLEKAKEQGVKDAEDALKTIEQKVPFGLRWLYGDWSVEYPLTHVAFFPLMREIDYE